MRDFKVLMKSNWFASDVQAYYGCSQAKAINIIATVKKEYGVIQADKNSEKQSVSADDVIKVMGGKDRLTEMQILAEYQKATPKIIIPEVEENNERRIEPIIDFR